MKHQATESLTGTVTPRTSTRKNNDYQELRKRIAGALKRVAGESVIIRLPIAPKHGSAVKAIRLFMQAVDFDQTYECRCCHRFLEDSWNLATISPDGNWESIWSRIVPTGTFVNMVTTLASWADSVRGVRPTKNYPAIYTPRHADMFMGKKEEGGFGHFYAPNPTKTEFLDLAEKHRNEGEGTLAETIKLLWDTASKVTQAKIDATNEALHDPSISRTTLPHRKMLDEWSVFAGQMLSKRSQSDKFWLIVATAIYKGKDFTHFKNSLAGQLMWELDELPKARAIRNYNTRADPMAYQRPQVVKAGNVARAEKVFEQLGLEDSLKRRHARWTDLEGRLTWSPSGETLRREIKSAPTSGIFGSLTGSPAPKRRTASTTVENITMSKFMRQVMPVAKMMDISVPVQGWFYGITAPSVKGSRPLVRYPGGIAWYTYQSPTHADSWGLAGLKEAPVAAVMPFPCDWDQPEVKRGWMFLIATPAAAQTPGLCLFPESLVPEVREVRSTIEGFSNKGTLGGPIEMCALTVSPDNDYKVKVRVNGDQVYAISFD